MHQDESSRPEPHVACDVKNCVYHGGQGCCTAKEIKVGPVYAAAQCDTVCATFKAQS